MDRWQVESLERDNAKLEESREVVLAQARDLKEIRSILNEISVWTQGQQ